MASADSPPFPSRRGEPPNIRVNQGPTPVAALTTNATPTTAAAAALATDNQSPSVLELIPLTNTNNTHINTSLLSSALDQPSTQSQSHVTVHPLHGNNNE